jgi:hypothetical protein
MAVHCDGTQIIQYNIRIYIGVDIELARLVMARYCNEPARLGSLY